MVLWWWLSLGSKVEHRCYRCQMSLIHLVLSLHWECKYFAVIFTACKMWKFTLFTHQWKIASPHMFDVVESVCQWQFFLYESQRRISYVLTEMSWTAWRMLKLHASCWKVGSEKLHVVGRPLTLGRQDRVLKCGKHPKNTKVKPPTLVTHALLAERD
jgi:hypothetical protein